jgi:ribonucleoside-diphosphate reductase alpha chain
LRGKEEKMEKTERMTSFDAFATSLAKRQYAQPGEEVVEDIFRRVAREIAKPERPE